VGLRERVRARPLQLLVGMPKISSRLTLGVLALATLASVADAAPKVYPTAKMQMTLPDGWAVKDAKNGVTLVGAPSNDAGLIVFPAASPTPDTVKKSVDDLVAAMNITGVTWDATLEKGTVNKLPMFARKGAGTSDGKADDLATILVMNGSSGLVVISVVQHDRKDAYKDVLTSSVLSIQASN
jgi:hypothetical protein